MGEEQDFVVAICSEFDKDMELFKVKAIDDREAIFSAIMSKAETEEQQGNYAPWVAEMRERCPTAKDVISELWDGDINAGVIQI